MGDSSSLIYMILLVGQFSPLSILYFWPEKILAKGRWIKIAKSELVIHFEMKQKFGGKYNKPITEIGIPVFVMNGRYVYKALLLC